jgi:hypothetical protein
MPSHPSSLYGPGSDAVGVRRTPRHERKAKEQERSCAAGRIRIAVARVRVQAEVMAFQAPLAASSRRPRLDV